MPILSLFPLILSISVYRKSSCFKIHGMFLLTVVSRAIFCGASFAYYSRLVSEDSPFDSIPVFYQVISTEFPFLLYAFTRPCVLIYCEPSFCCNWCALTLCQAACYLTGFSLFVTILLIGKAPYIAVLVLLILCTSSRFLYPTVQIHFKHFFYIRFNRWCEMYVTDFAWLQAAVGVSSDG